MQDSRDIFETSPNTKELEKPNYVTSYSEEQTEGGQQKDTLNIGVPNSSLTNDMPSADCFELLKINIDHPTQTLEYVDDMPKITVSRPIELNNNDWSDDIDLSVSSHVPFFDDAHGHAHDMDEATTNSQLSTDCEVGTENENLSTSQEIPDGLRNQTIQECVEGVEYGPVPYPGRPKRGRKQKVMGQSRSDKKRLLNRNKMHVNSKGEFVQPKYFDDKFICKCQRNCTNVVSMDSRKQMFDQFWDIGSHEGRAALIISCVSEILKKTTRTNGPSKRYMTRKYEIFGHSVCKVAFLKTLQINQSRLDTALNKHFTANTFADLRGQESGGKNALPLSKKLEVYTHINSFPRYVSHYCREKTDARFLSPKLDLMKMYSLYKEDHTEPVSLASYKRVFYDSFNLKFKSPKKDTCQKCDFYQIEMKKLSGEQLQELQECYTQHLMKAEEWQNKMKADLAISKVNPEVETIPFDQQKTQSFPHLTSNIAYYKRQLNLYNQGLHVGSSGKGIFNLWMENEGGKGTQEVGSCLRKYINEHIKAPVKTLILWCDSCGGQNRSIKLMLALIHILQNHSSLETIKVKFLMSGHSFLPNDSDFGDVERKFKKKENVYTDAQYIKVMLDSRRENKFVINRLSSKDFLSVNSLEKAVTNRKFDKDKDKVNWLKTHQITMEKAHPTVLKMSNDVSDSDYQVVDIGKRGKQEDLKSIVLEPLWPQGKGLSKNKIEDLKYLMKLVPEEHRSFYSFLETVESDDFEDDVDGFFPYDIENL